MIGQGLWRKMWEDVGKTHDALMEKVCMCRFAGICCSKRGGFERSCWIPSACTKLESGKSTIDSCQRVESAILSRIDGIKPQKVAKATARFTCLFNFVHIIPSRGIQDTHKKPLVGIVCCWVCRISLHIGMFESTLSFHTLASGLWRQKTSRDSLLADAMPMGRSQSMPKVGDLAKPPHHSVHQPSTRCHNRG